MHSPDAATRPAEPASRHLDSVKDHAFLTDLLIEMEGRFDVNALKLDCVNIWPLVRLQLGRSFKEADPIADAGFGEGIGSGTAEALLNDLSARPRNRAERSLRLQEHARSARLDPERAIRRVREDLENLCAVAGPRFAVMTKIEKYYLKRGDRHYAPILDPVIEDLAAFGRVQPVAVEPFQIACVNEPLRIDPASFLATHSPPPLSIPAGIDRMLTEMEHFTIERWPEYPLKRKLVYSRMKRLRERKNFFREAFQALKPEVLVVSSFTGWLHALWAAKDLAIPVVDVQHGGQGPIHFPTTHFSALPSEGYHFLPDVLWLWGETNRRFGARWLPGPCKRHFPVVGGHRGVARWRANRTSVKLADIDRKFLERFDGKPNVLVTLSYAISPLMPEVLSQAVAATPGLTWLIRLHPIHRPPAARDQLIQRLHELGCRNFFIDEPTDVQLQTALAVSRVHFTPFSTAVREASAFNVPSAVVHPAGELLFREEIATGGLSYTDTTERIVAFARAGIECERSEEHDRDSIEIASKGLEDVIAAAELVRREAPPLQSSLGPSTPKRVGRSLLGRLAGFLERLRA